jgi:SAM-dependent methyltransferase
MMLTAFTGASPEPAPGPAVTWDEPNCPLCGHAAAAPVVEAPDPTPGQGGLWFAVVRCLQCSLHYTRPRPDPDSIGRFYPANYRPHRHRSDRPVRRWYPMAAIQGRPCPERRALPWHGEGRLLDFGCGSGVFLDRMAKQGWHVLGLDSSPATVEFVRTQLGLPAVVGTLPHPDLAPGSFDVVTMWHSLEHVHQPLEVLRQAFRLLVPGGKLFVAVPNIGGWAFRWFGRDWFGLDLPRHLTHFDPGTLTAMLERAGFRHRPFRLHDGRGDPARGVSRHRGRPDCAGSGGAAYGRPTLRRAAP